MSEVEEVVAIFGVGDHVWVPWSTIINSITIKVKNEPSSNKNSIKTNKLIRYWPAFVLERHVTTKLRKVAYARIVPTSTPQNDNSLSPKYLVKLIGLNVNQVFYEKSLRSWLSFNPNPLPEISSVNDFNLSGQDTSLSDITIEKLSALYVQAIQKVSNKLKPAFDPRDYNSETSKDLAAEPVNTNSSNPVRLRIIYNKNSKDSINNSSNSKANKLIPTSIYKPVASSINVNTPSSAVNLEEYDRDQEKAPDDKTKKKAAELQANTGSNNSNDNITQISSNDFIIKNEIKQVESNIISTTSYEQPIVLAKEQESPENLNSFRSFKKKRGRKPSKNVIAKLDPSTKVSAMSQSTTDDSSLLRRTRNGSVFGKWRASKRSRHAQENLEQNDLVLDQNNNNFISNDDVSVQYDINVSSISTSKAVSVQTKDSVSKNKRKLTIGVKKTPIDQSRCPNQVNKDDIELLVNESKRRKIQDDSVKVDDDLRGNNVDEKPMEINSEPNNSLVQCNNEVKSILKPDVTRTGFHKRRNEGKSKPKTQNTTQMSQRKVESEKIKKEKKIRNHSNCNTKCVLNVAPLDLNQTLVEDNYMQISQQQDDVSGMIEMKNEQERIVNDMNDGNNSLSLVFSSPLQSFRSVLGFGNIFSWNKRSIDT